MKLNLFLTLSHVTAAAIGAGVLWMIGPGSTSAITAAAVAIGISGAIGFALSRSIGGGLRLIQQADHSRSETPAQAHPIQDVQEVIKHIRSRAVRWSDAVSNARHQAQEIESLLEAISQGNSSDGPDRIGSAVSQLKRVLHQLNGQLKSELDQISTQVSEVQENSGQIAAGAEDQSEAVNRTTTYVEQLSLQFDSVAENANAAQRSALKAGEVASQARSMVEQHLEHIDGFRTRVEGAERKLRALGERTEAIGAIVETITAISSRTDLLALNASIESIRAGEQGRGFSIVAEEVRKLAEQAAQATRQVSNLIETIQTETDESIRAMAEQREDVHAELKRMSSTRNQLGLIGETCQESVARIQDISRLAGQQLHLTQDLVVAVERISETTRSIRSRTEGAGWTIRSISQHVETLNHTLAPLRAGMQAENHRGRQRTNAADLSDRRSGSPTDSILSSVSPELSLVE